MTGTTAHPVRIATWSGPRNISTATMRAFENRADCAVLDEPLYAAYLHRTGLDHPGRDEVVAAGETDLDVVVDALLHGAPPQADAATTVHYAKHMSHHVPDDLDLAWTDGLANLLLVRDPAEVVASYVRSRESCEPDDIGLLQQARLAAHWRERGVEVPVVDAADFLRDPETYLRWICDHVGIDFDPAMLSWPAGPRASDGVWAPYWYAAVQRSTGFEPYRPRQVDLSPHDAAVAEACRPAYEELAARRVRP
ncbi:HAD family hydrolase [Solicola sp. PLA-1-18]|uniref:sulfotransferase-like domain-containing protein n=1 Tax=Solicola sp. PLA-1-18 TaxID=3380532 RepID=UPI003B78697C